MKLGVFVIYDSKAMVYARPMYIHNDAMAMRMAHDVRHNEETDIFRHPEDFTLFKLGEYDDSDASFHLLTPKQTVINFAEVPYVDPHEDQQELPLAGEDDSGA